MSEENLWRTANCNLFSLTLSDDSEEGIITGAPLLLCSSLEDQGSCLPSAHPHPLHTHTPQRTAAAQMGSSKASICGRSPADLSLTRATSVLSCSLPVCLSVFLLHTPHTTHTHTHSAHTYIQTASLIPSLSYFRLSPLFFLSLPFPRHAVRVLLC